MDTSSVLIGFAINADQSKLSPYSRGVLLDNFAATKNPKPKINSTTRGPVDQARAMFNNLELPGGVEKNKKLYDPPGQAVVAVYVACKAKHLTPDAIKSAMVSEIIRQGPTKVSHHCSDPAKLQVFDVGLDSLANPKDFQAACKADSRISKCILEEAFNCFHIEIPQV